MLRTRYRPTDSRVILPTNTNGTSTHRSHIRKLVCLLLLLMVVTGATLAYTQMRPPQYVTLDAPSFDTELTPVLARVVRREELANGVVETMPFPTLVAKMKASMAKHNLQCITANAIGIPLRVMIMSIESEIVLINPTLTWTSASVGEQSEILETSPLYTYADPVPVTRPHRIQVKFLNQHGADQILMLAGKQSHCVQSSMRLFRGITVYNDS